MKKQPVQISRVSQMRRSLLNTTTVRLTSIIPDCSPRCPESRRKPRPPANQAPCKTCLQASQEEGEEGKEDEKEEFKDLLVKN